METSSSSLSMVLFPCPDTSSPDYENWYCTDQNLVNNLSATLSDPILGTVVGCKTSAAIWNHIQNQFKKKSTANSSHLRCRLHELTRGSHTVSEYLDEVKTISDHLSSIGERPTNTDLV